MKTLKFLTVPILAVVMICSMYTTVFAEIPAFARKYNLSCITCHDAFPRLKPYGEDFAGNGFKLPDKEEPPRAYINTGDAKLYLQRDLPLAFRFDAYFSATPDEKVTNDFKAPWGLKILSGGAVTENVGYYLYFFFSERGEVAGIEDAYIHFNNLGGSELDLMVGQFQISDPLFKRELRLTFEDYEFYKTRVGFSNANLAYDRGIMFTYSTETKTDLALQLLNGNGKDEANPDRNFDIDSNKSVFFRFVQDAKYFNIGGFTYIGKEKGMGFGNTAGPGIENTFTYVGPDINIVTKKADFAFQYINRQDDNPLFLNVGAADVTTESLIGELIFKPVDRVRAIALYNKIWTDVNDLKTATDYETINLNLSFLHNSNLKMMSEFGYNIEREKFRWLVGFVAGF